MIYAKGKSPCMDTDSSILTDTQSAVNEEHQPKHRSSCAAQPQRCIYRQLKRYLVSTKHLAALLAVNENRKSVHNRTCRSMQDNHKPFFSF